MSLFHGRHRRATRLLALGVLGGTEAEAARRHAGACARCAAELQNLAHVLGAVKADPLRLAEPPIPLGALVARVRARLEHGGAPRVVPAVRPGFSLALVTAVVVALALRTPQPHAEPPATPLALPEDALRRAERGLAREQTARYLTAAQDVLVTVVASPQRCPLRAERIDVGEEARRSRQLLARRALLDVEDSGVSGPVMDDVERVLREVASLEPCARRGDLEAIHREVSERHLLMKIGLVAGELRG